MPSTPQILHPYDSKRAEAGAPVYLANGSGPLRYFGPVAGAKGASLFEWLTGPFKGAIVQYLESDLRLASPLPADVTLARLQRKLAERDRKIEGLRRRVADLEHALASLELTNQKLPQDLERAVQRALSNVRLIPVLGIGHNDKIVSISAVTPDPKPKEA